jgi:hypothetical protein
MADGCIAPQFLDRLRRFLVLGELEARVLEQLGRFISWHKYNPSQLIYSESDPSTDVWFILDGSVRAVLRTPTGKELIINELGPGDMFGEIAAIDGAGRTASISAISKTRLCSIPAAPFLEAVHSSSAASHALLKALAGVMRPRSGGCRSGRPCPCAFAFVRSSCACHAPGSLASRAASASSALPPSMAFSQPASAAAGKRFRASLGN